MRIIPLQGRGRVRIEDESRAGGGEGVRIEGESHLKLVGSFSKS